MEQAQLTITNMNCASCVALIEKTLKETDGVSAALVNFASEKAHVEFDQTKIGLEKIIDIIQKLGFGARECTHDARSQKMQQTHEHHKESSLRRSFLLSFVLSIPLFYLAMGSIINLPPPPFSAAVSLILQFVITTGIMLANAPIYVSGFKKLIARNPNMDSLIEVGTVAAYAYSIAIAILMMKNPDMPTGIHVYFESAGFILLFISLGKYLEARTKGKARESVQQLIGLQPKNAIVERNGKERVIPMDEVLLHDTVIVKPGGKVPVDGVIVEGASTIDESMITGESIPVEKAQGDVVIGGTINKTSLFRFRATKVGKDTMLSHIIDIVEQAISSKAPIQLLADTISFYFVPAVFGIAFVSFGIWMLLGYGFAFALTVFVAVLIIACPCALGLATPAAVMMGAGISARRGILIKTSAALETAHKVDTIVFDKTGTLTKGKPSVVEIKVFDADEDAVVKIAFSLALLSHHPISEAVARYGEKVNAPKQTIEQMKEMEGKGVFGYHHGKKVVIGNEKIIRGEHMSVTEGVMQAVEDFAKNGKTPLFVGRDDRVIGVIAIADEVKDTARAAIERLQKRHKKIIMITGDKKEVGDAIARQLGIDEVVSEVLPHDKSSKIKDLQKQGRIVAMVGDGINDAPALAQAHLGIALGSGTDVALETGEIVLVKNELLDVARAMEISEYTLRKIKQNLFWAFFYNVAGIPIAAGILYPFTGFLLNPAIAAFAMAFSSVSVVSNALLMKLKKVE